MDISLLLFPVTFLLMYIFFAKNIKELYMVFFMLTPFTATSLLNIGGISISLPLYSGLFLIIKFILKLLQKMKLKKIRINKFLMIFYIFSIFSIFSPLYIDKNFKITSNWSNEFINYFLLKKYEVIISHLLYLTYCLIIYFITIYIIKFNQIKIEELVKVYKKSFYLVFLFSLVEIISYKVGLIDKFNKIFRMNESTFVQGYGNFVRISGPNGEPSMFSIYLLVSLGIFYFYKQKKEAVLAIFLGIVSTSTSFVLGLLAYIVLNIVSLKRRRILEICICMLVIMVIIMGLLSVYPQITILFTDIIRKISGEGISGNDRMFNMMSHFKVSISVNPFFGIGFGVARSKDLLTTWLVNIGYLGVISFILALLNSILSKRNKSIGIVLIVAFIVEFISVPEPYFLYLWCLWGILDSNIKIKMLKKEVL